MATSQAKDGHAVAQGLAPPYEVRYKVAMSIWQWLGLAPKDADAGGEESDTIRKIARELQALPREQARYLACFAYVLGRVAYADRDISDDESRVMELILMQVGHLPESQAVLAAEIAKSQNILAGGTENYIVTRALGEQASAEQREEVLHCLFAVAAADDSISSEEEAQIRQIAAEMGIADREFIRIRGAYNEQREVVRRLRKLEPEGL